MLEPHSTGFEALNDNLNKITEARDKMVAASEAYRKISNLAEHLRLPNWQEEVDQAKALYEEEEKTYQKFLGMA